MLTLQAVLAEVDMETFGATALAESCTLKPLLPCLITWRAKHPIWKPVKIQYLLLQVVAPISWKGNPVNVLTSGQVPDSRLSLLGFSSFHSGGIVYKRAWSGMWGSCRYCSPSADNSGRKAKCFFFFLSKGEKSWLWLCFLFIISGLGCIADLYYNITACWLVGFSIWSILF